MITFVPTEQIPTLFNPWRECIDGQIRTDLWGYIAPSNLQKAALAYKDCSFSLVKNDIYRSIVGAAVGSGKIPAQW